MLSAGTESSTALGDRVMEDLFDNSIRGIFERLLKGEFDFLSAIVLPRANDSAHRLYYYLCELQRTGEANLPPVLLCDIAMTPDEATRKYTVDALGRLWEELKAISGSRAGDEELVSGLLNASTHWSSAVSLIRDFRRQGGAESAPALAAFAAARMLPGNVSQEVIRGAIAPKELGQRKPRVIICGSTQYDAGLHSLVEDAGGLVVGDYHAGGEPAIGPIIEIFEPTAPLKRKSQPPLELIADAYRTLPAATRNFGDAGHVRRFATDAEANLAIFSYFPEEEALTWDYPEQKAALEKRGLKVLRLADQTRPFDVAAHRDVVTAFVRGGV
jgi:hypothetical protein